MQTRPHTGLRERFGDSTLSVKYQPEEQPQITQLLIHFNLIYLQIIFYLVDSLFKGKSNHELRSFIIDTIYWVMLLVCIHYHIKYPVEINYICGF